MPQGCNYLVQCRLPLPLPPPLLLPVLYSRSGVRVQMHVYLLSLWNCRGGPLTLERPCTPDEGGAKRGVQESSPSDESFRKLSAW